jgi:hypothetical protein
LIAADVTGTALLKGTMVEDSKNGKYVQFLSALVDVDVKDYHVRVEHLFPDKQLSKFLNTEALLNITYSTL